MKMDFSCPTCNVSLQAQKLEDIRVWKCESCRGFTISLPIVRKGLKTETFKKIWRKLSLGETEAGRPCPGCKDPLDVVEAGGKGGVIPIDVCRTCQVFWFDDKEFAGLPKVEQKKQSVSELHTPADLAFSVFKDDHYKNRSMLFKLLDGSVAKELGLDRFFDDFFDE